MNQTPIDQELAQRLAQEASRAVKDITKAAQHLSDECQDVIESPATLANHIAEIMEGADRLRREFAAIWRPQWPTYLPDSPIPVMRPATEDPPPDTSQGPEVA